MKNVASVTWESDGHGHWPNGSRSICPESYYVMIENRDGERARIDCNSKKQAIELAKAIKEAMGRPTNN